MVGDAKLGEIRLSWTITRQKGGFIRAGDPKDLELTVEQYGDRLVVKDQWRGSRIADRPNIHMVMTVHPATLVSGSMGNGTVHLNVSEGSSFRLDSTVGIGQIDVDGVKSEREWSFLGGSVTAAIGGGNGKLDISAGNGQVELDVLASPEN